ETAPAAHRPLDDVRLIREVVRLYDGDPLDLGWSDPGDMPTLRGVRDIWGPRISEARLAVAKAKTVPHGKRYDAGLCREYPKSEHKLFELQRPEHPLQVVAVGEHRYPDGHEVYRVSRIEPGEDPGVDAAMNQLLRVRAELRAELE